MNNINLKKILFVERILMFLVINIMQKISFVTINLWIMKSKVINTNVIGISDLITCILTIVVMISWKFFSEKLFKNINIILLIKFVFDTFIIVSFFSFEFKKELLFLIYINSLNSFFNNLDVNCFRKVSFDILGSKEEIQKYIENNNILMQIGILIYSLICVYVNISLEACVVIYYISQIINVADSLVIYKLYNKRK